MTERERILCVLRRTRPDRPPWATRLDLWLESGVSGGSLPERLRDMPAMEVYRALGVGRQAYVPLTLSWLRGVDMVADFDGEVFLRQREPRVHFPLVTDLVPPGRPGVATFIFTTPAGTCGVRYTHTPESADGATLPFLTGRPVADDQDFAPLLWILDHAEIVADYGPFVEREQEIGEHGLAIGMIDRIPFQRVLLDFLGEERTFFEMHDEPARFARLLGRLDALERQSVEIACASPAAMVEHTDNLDGEMTNPALFARYCMPALQRSAEAAHRAAKALGSHMDGDMSALLDLVPECGVDVAESFSPEPLSRLTFSRAWQRWRGRVIPWGCIPSPLFEPEAPVERLALAAREALGSAREEGGIILGIADQAVSRTLAERIELVSRLVEDGTAAPGPAPTPGRTSA